MHIVYHTWLTLQPQLDHVIDILGFPLAICLIIICRFGGRMMNGFLKRYDG